ncbi:MAG: hypothetical protein WBP12_01155 [Candidatus Saccharimonas sp.]
MRKEYGLHPAQTSALELLRRVTTARFSDMLRETTLTSDTFKFHVRKLMSLGYVNKNDDGLYELTIKGKEFANRLDETTGLQIEQPKASILLLGRSIVNGVTYYLAHRRTREPYRDWWGIASAPVLRGVPLAESATRGFRKQTGIETEFRVVSMARVIDKTHEGEVLEDKIFSVMVADVEGAPKPHDWHGGESVWLTREEILQLSPLFPTTAHTFDRLDQGTMFAEDVCEYDASDY